MCKNILDSVIVGAGLAGMTSGVYFVRNGIKNIKVVGITNGSQLNNKTSYVENFLFSPPTKGSNLVDTFKKNASCFLDETMFKNELVKTIKKNDGIFELILNNGEILYSYSIVMCAGCSPKMLYVEGEQLPGVSYCAICDGNFFTNEDVIVVGGGSVAVENAIFLSNIVKSVTVLNRNKYFKGETILHDKFFSTPNIQVLYSVEVAEIIGNTCVEGVILKNGNKINCKGVFISIGIKAANIEYEFELQKNTNDEIIVDKLCRSSVEGLFAAGDQTDIPFKQISIAVGSATVATMSCMLFISQKKNKN